jgi:predicted nucleotidyltransferase
MVGERLRGLLAFAKSTRQLSCVFFWGSFVTSKEVPNDLDVLLVMAVVFTLETLPAYCRVVFDHVQVRLHFHAGVFWSEASIDAQALQLWLGTYQTGMGFNRKGIVEVIVS